MPLRLAEFQGTNVEVLEEPRDVETIAVGAPSEIFAGFVKTSEKDDGGS